MQRKFPPFVKSVTSLPLGEVINFDLSFFCLHFYNRCNNQYYGLAYWVKISANDISKYLLYLPRKKELAIHANLETLCMNSAKNKKNTSKCHLLNLPTEC